MYGVASVSKRVMQINSETEQSVKLTQGFKVLSREKEIHNDWSGNS